MFPLQIGGLPADRGCGLERESNGDFSGQPGEISAVVAHVVCRVLSQQYIPMPVAPRERTGRGNHHPAAVRL
jgi:hypothetical protein